MKRYLYILWAVTLGVGLYAADVPGLSAQQAAVPEAVTVVASAESQSAVARLAEASLAQRRMEGNPVIATYPEPSPEKLFSRP